jgi:hypothetical protein
VHAGGYFKPQFVAHEAGLSPLTCLILCIQGSLVGREVSAEEIKDKPRVTMKDVNWINLSRRLLLGPDKQKIFLEQVEKDTHFLMKMDVMDYSLLTGVHYLKRGNSENIRDKSLSVFEVKLHDEGVASMDHATQYLASPHPIAKHRQFGKTATVQQAWKQSQRHEKSDCPVGSSAAGSKHKQTSGRNAE